MSHAGRAKSLADFGFAAKLANLKSQRKTEGYSGSSGQVYLGFRDYCNGNQSMESSVYPMKVFFHIPNSLWFLRLSLIAILKIYYFF